jgi:hypothetical protein
MTARSVTLACTWGDRVVGEALFGEGLVRKPFDESIDGCEWVAVRRLKTPPATMQPVLDKANAYLNQENRYASEQILLLAVICTTRNLDLSKPLVRRLAHWVIAKAAEMVRLMERDGKQPMICSEFVYRCYDEAVTGKPDPYRIEVKPVGEAAPRARLLGWRRRDGGVAALTAFHPESLWARIQEEAGGLATAIKSLKVPAVANPSAGDEAELDALIEVCLPAAPGTARRAAIRPLAAAPEVTNDDLRDAMGQLAVALHGATGGGTRLGMETFGPSVTRRGASPGETLEEVVADFVTPGDLFRSQSLSAVGKLVP